MITDYLTEPILCAVSGGADSMYMLNRLRDMGYAVMAAHFNHGLRGAEADRDEAFVHDFCAAEGIPFFAGRGDVRAYAERRGLSLETAARELRYEFLRRTAVSCRAACIATAHTADDNAETILFHLARGTGLRGLGGIPPVRDGIVRPILDETRQSLLAWLKHRGIAYVEDSTNASDDYARNRIRHTVTPVLEELNGGFLANTARMAALLRADEELLQSMARRHVAEHGADARALTDAPAPIASRAVRILFGETLGEIHVCAALRVAREGGAADVPGQRIVRKGGKLCRETAAAEKTLPERALSFGETGLPEAGMRVFMRRVTAPCVPNPNVYTLFFAEDAICGTMSVSARRAGDSLRPIGRGCTKTMKQLFQEAGVEPRQRPVWPVLRDEKGVLAVYGIAADERTAGGGENTNYIELQFISIREEETI